MGDLNYFYCDNVTNIEILFFFSLSTFELNNIILLLLPFFAAVLFNMAIYCKNWPAVHRQFPSGTLQRV